MFVGWNGGKSAPLALSDTSLAKNQSFSAEDGVTACKFRLDAKLNFTGKLFAKETYFLRQ